MDKSCNFLYSRVKLAKLFYKDPPNSLKELLMSKSPECSNLINKAKENYQRKMAEILQNPLTVPKPYWSIPTNLIGKQNS